MAPLTPTRPDGALPGEGMASPTASAAMMLLTDGRFPSGGHAYSAGMEQAVTWGDVSTLESAEAFTVGRASTVGTLAAQVTAAANLTVMGASTVLEVRQALDRLDGAVDARTASAAARRVSRLQGRRWLRAVQGTWPDELAGQETDSPRGWQLRGRHGWVVLGAATALLDLTAEQAATVALYELVGTPLWAAVRLLGLDPMQTAAVIARLVTRFEPEVRAAANGARAMPPSVGAAFDLSWISWSTAPLSDLAAEAHVGREERLFAS
jgi:urease accessory protein